MRGVSKYKKRIAKPDEIYGSTAATKFINYIMERGKKETAKKIFYDSLEISAKELNKDGIEVFNEALQIVAPSVEVRSRRIGGANYQIPMEVKEPRRTSLAMRWLIAAAKDRSGMPMADRLAKEYVDILNGTGAAIKKKTDTHKMAEANRAFAHFAKIK